MFSCLGAWILTTLLAQAPTESRAVLLEKIPADAEIAVTLRSLEATRADFLAMINAMSPTVGKQVEPMVTSSLQQMTERFGKEAADTPFAVAMKLPKPGEAMPTFAVLLPIEDYASVVKRLAGTTDAPKLEPQGGGVDKFTDKDGQAIYAYDGAGFVAFSPEHDTMVKAIAAKPQATLAGTLSPELRETLLGGDVGAYVDLKAVQAQYGDQIDAMREQFMALLDQAGAQTQQKAQMDQAKQLYSAMFDSLKQADGLALNVDFDKAALDLTGFLSLKSDSPSLESLKAAHRGTADKLGMLPPGYLVYACMNIDPKTTEGLMKLNLGSLYPSVGTDNPAAQKYLEAIKEQGRQEGYTAMSMGGGMDVVAVNYPENVEKGTQAMLDMMKAMTDSPVIKEAKVEENVATYKGYKLNTATIRFDFEKMIGEQANNPMAAGMLKALFGPDASMTSYFGTDGTRLISVSAKSLDEAKQKIDVLTDGTGGIGATAGYQALRDRLPKEVNVLMAMSAQGLVRMVGQMLGTLTGGEPIAPPADMPKDLALFGGSLGFYPTGYRFDFVLPSAVGPVIEKGLVPIFQGMQGQVNQ